MTLLIRNVRIVGGEKSAPPKVDVFVSGKRISAIGNFPQKQADTVIDGKGSFLSPGFIDIDTTSDHYLTLFHDFAQGDFLRQGVTSIIGGHCGASLAPLLYGALESVRKWADIRTINVNWNSMEEFFGVVAQNMLGVNFGTFVGHSTIRRALIGEVLRDLTKNELSVFVNTLSRALKEGALGLSAGLEYVHARMTSQDELRALLIPVAHEKKIFSLHMRKTGVGVWSAVEEALSLSRESDVALLLTHLVPIRETGEEYDRALHAILKQENVNFSVYPLEESIIPIYRMLPEWAQNGSLEVMHEYVRDDIVWDRIAKEMRPLDPDEIRIIRAHGVSPLAGLTLGEVMDLYETMDVRSALRIVMKSTEMNAVLVQKTIDTIQLRKALVHKKSIIGSHAPSIGGTFYEDAFRGTYAKPDRGTATFSMFLKMVLEENLMPFEDAIRKITEIPAALCGFSRRGSVREGYFADLVIFSPRGEIQCVIVNGVIAVLDGAIINARSGIVLKKTDK